MAKMSAMDLIKKAAKGPEPKSKTKTPVVTLQGPLTPGDPKSETYEDAISDWLKANQDKKDAEARQAAAEAKFFDSAEKSRIAECRRDGKYHSSVKINDEVLYGVQNRYSAIKSEDMAKLEEVFGDRTDVYFKEKTEITLTEAALTDEKILEKLVAAVGPENFGTYFEVEQHVAPTEAFHEGRATDLEIGEKAEKVIKAGIVRPAKASCKLA